MKPLFALLLSVCTSTLANASDLPLAHELKGFAPLPLNLVTTQAPSPLSLLEQLTTGFPSNEEGRPKLDIQMVQDGSRITVNVIETGWPDDSVAGQATRVLMEEIDGQWTITGIGRMRICARGEMRYTSGLCP